MRANIKRGTPVSIYSVKNGLVTAKGENVLARMKANSTLFYFASQPMWNMYGFNYYNTWWNKEHQEKGLLLNLFYNED